MQYFSLVAAIMALIIVFVRSMVIEEELKKLKKQYDAKITDIWSVTDEIRHDLNHAKNCVCSRKGQS